MTSHYFGVPELSLGATNYHIIPIKIGTVSIFVFLISRFCLAREIREIKGARTLRVLQYASQSVTAVHDAHLYWTVDEGQRSSRCDDDNTVADTRRHQGGGDQWLLNHTADEWCSCVHVNGAARHSQSSRDDTHNCCADYNSGCYDDGMSTFYVNYAHQAADVFDVGHAAPTLSGVKVCGPANLELLFLIDQLASTSCFVDETNASIFTLLQNSAASALYVDSSPRVVEQYTDDDGNLTADATTARDAVDVRQDSGDSLLSTDTDRTTLAGATGCETHLKTSSVAVDCSEVTGERRRQVRRRHEHSGEQEREKTHAAAAQIPNAAILPRRRVPDVRGTVCVSPVNKDNDKLTSTTASGMHEVEGRHRQRGFLPPLDLDATRSTTVTKYNRVGLSAVQLTSLRTGLADDAGLHRQQQQPRSPAEAQRRLPDVFVDRKPPLPAAAKRPEPSVGRGLHLPPVKNTQRIPRQAPRVFPPPPQHRRSHPLAPRRPMTPPNRNVLTSRAVWPSMASGRPVEDDWTRRAAAMRRRIRLTPLDHAATISTWHWPLPTS